MPVATKKPHIDEDMITLRLRVQRHISEMENGKRTIGKELAKRLGKALNADYKVFL